MAALLLCMLVLTGCDKPENEPETTLDEVVEETTEATTEVTTKPEDTVEASEGLAFVSNGDGTCYVSGIGECTDTDVVIPAVSPDGDIVTVISNSAFYGCTNLTSITIPDGVTSIGGIAFFGCTALTDVHYSGTKYQWQAIENRGNNSLYTATIHCTDGDITPAT